MEVTFLGAAGTVTGSRFLVVGFQAPGTRGASLGEGAGRIKMHGRWIPVGAEPSPDQVQLVHGEPPPAELLGVAIQEEPGLAVRAAEDGEEVRLT